MIKVRHGLRLKLPSFVGINLRRHRYQCKYIEMVFKFSVFVSSHILHRKKKQKFSIKYDRIQYYYVFYALNNKRDDGVILVSSV